MNYELISTMLRVCLIGHIFIPNMQMMAGSYKKNSKRGGCNYLCKECPFENPTSHSQ